MQITHIPLLQIARDLQDIPRGMERFNTYLDTITTEGREDAKYPPLMLLNPMAREHITERLDHLLTMGAETLAADAVRVAADAFTLETEPLQHGLALLDDVRGGWTSRYTNDAALRFGENFPNAQKRRWLTTALWVSDTPTPDGIRQAVIGTVARYAWMCEHGTPRTLRELMRQEGAVMRFAGMTPTLDADDIDYTREVLMPYLDTTSYAVWVAAMYGDGAARSLGYEPLGLSADAGFMTALTDSGAY